MAEVEAAKGPVKKVVARKKKPKVLALIDQNGCTGCEACIAFCPVDCILIVPGPAHPDFDKLVEVDLERCIGCTLCEQYCPWETIKMLPHDEAYEKAPDWTFRTVVYPNGFPPVPPA